MIGAQLDAPVVPPAPPRARPAAAATGLERYRLAHRALPGRDLADVSLATELLGAALAAPLVLEGRARTAAELHVAAVVPAGERVADRPPLLLAALALGPLLDDPDRAARAIGATGADGLAVDLDPLGGDGRAARAGEAIALAVAALTPLPVLVRARTGGMDGADARALRELGVAAVDVGGVGPGPGAAFADWGVPTADGVAEAALLAPGLPVVAPAVDGVQAAMCLALGAAALAVGGGDAATVLHQLRVAAWATGVPAVAALNAGHLRDRLA